MKRQVFAKVVLCNPDGLVLLIRRSATDDRRANEWDMPGGTIEPGEEVNRGAAREVSEETGIIVDPAALELAFAESGIYKNDSNTRLLFVAHTKANEVQLSHEHSEHKWVSVEQALADFPHPVYVKGLRFARDNGLLAVA